MKKWWFYIFLVIAIVMMTLTVNRIEAGNFSIALACFAAASIAFGFFMWEKITYERRVQAALISISYRRHEMSSDLTWDFPQFRQDRTMILKYLAEKEQDDFRKASMWLGGAA